MTQDKSTAYDYDHFDPDIPEGHVLCPRCDGHQTIACRCGGDQCFCGNDGEAVCPYCGGEYGGAGYVPKDDRYERYIKRQAEMIAAFHAAMKDNWPTKR